MMRLLLPILLISFISLGQKENQSFIETEVKVEYIYNSNSAKGILYKIDSNAIYLISEDQLRKLKKGDTIITTEAKLVPITSINKIFTRNREKRVRSLIFGASIGLIITVITLPDGSPLGSLFSVLGAGVGTLSALIVAAVGGRWGNDYFLIQGEKEKYFTVYEALKTNSIRY